LTVPTADISKKSTARAIISQRKFKVYVKAATLCSPSPKWRTHLTVRSRWGTVGG